MTLQQMIDQLKLVQAQPQPEYRQAKLLTHEIEDLWPSSTTDSHEINEHHPVEVEFHQFSTLSLELRETIWQFALPAHRPLEIKIRINDEHQDRDIWAVGPFAILEVCKESRRIALSIYEPRLEFYTSQEKPGQVLCDRPSPMRRSDRRIAIYMRKEHAPIDIHPDSEVHSVVAWEDVPLGFLKMQEASLDFVAIKCFWNWPPEEDEEPIISRFRKAHYERYKTKFLPPRLQHISLGTSKGRVRGRGR